MSLLTLREVSPIFLRYASLTGTCNTHSVRFTLQIQGMPHATKHRGHVGPKCCKTFSTTHNCPLAQSDEWLLLPDRPPLTGLPRINTTPFTDAQRKRFQPKKVKTIKPFGLTIQKVKKIVPNNMIPKLMLTTATTHPISARRSSPLQPHAAEPLQ